MEPISNGRTQISKSASQVVLTIPGRKNIGIFLFSIVFFTIWFFGFRFVSNIPNFEGPFSMVFLGIWGLVGLMALFAIIATLFGKEIITLEKSALSIEKKVAGLGRKKLYDSKEVNNLRLTPAQLQEVVVVHNHDHHNPHNHRHYRKKKLGKISFDYGMKTIRFASDIEEAEALKLIELIEAYYGKEGQSS